MDHRFHHRLRYILPPVCLLILFIFVALYAPPPAYADRQPDPTLPPRNGSYIKKMPVTQSPTAGLVVEDLTGTLTPTDLAKGLVGSGVTISNIRYTGAEIAAGVFSNGDGIVGFNNGVILTSGSVQNVVGPNISDNITADNGLNGDADLSTLSGNTTYDASILEFDFVPAKDTVYFRFIFASDEYNEFVNSSYNDVFGFFVNGHNCATVEGDPVSVNMINYGNPYSTTPNSHPELYLNNDVTDGGGGLNTEMDGLTKVITCNAPVNPNQVNTMKLAIADASDTAFDSVVFIEGSSLIGSQVVELVGLEVTQAIQNWENDGDVPLIEDKTTYVRAHVKSTSGTIYNVIGELHGKRGVNALPDSPITPKNKGVQFDVKGNPSRNSLQDSFYFQLPSSWLNGTIELEFKGVNQSIACKDHTGTQDDCKVSITFQDTPALDLRLVGLIWEEDDEEHNPDWSDMLQVVDEVEAIFPVPDVEYDWPYSIKPLIFPVAPRNVYDWIRLNIMLMENRLWDCATGDCPRYYIGIANDPPWDASVTGASYVDSNIAAAYNDGFFTPSHELGHALGRNHTNCDGSEADPDPNYPYSGGHISEGSSGDTAYFGFNIKTETVYPPNSGDLMSYCSPIWPSDWTYRHLRDRIVSDAGESLAMLSTSQVSATQAVLVSGIISSTTSTGELLSIIPLQADTPPALPTPGAYTLRFEDAAGGMVAEYPFEPAVSAADSGTDPYLSFALLLPWSDQIDQVLLLSGLQLLDSRSASANHPTVKVDSPNGGEFWNGSTVLVQWTASDPDDDPLSFVVQYSLDGGSTWTTLNSKVTGNQYEVDVASLPGSAQAMIRVIASDGFHSSADSSDQVFSIARHAPMAQIQAPEDGALYVGDQLLVLDGAAYDQEDGILSGANLVWSSSLDGILGSGTPLDIEAAGLSEGIHTITLNASDSDSMAASSTISVTVYRNRPTLSPELDVSPTSGSFSVLVGSEQTAWQDLAIRNIGDGTISWEALPGESWVMISETSGFTPADISYAVDPTGLLPGDYTGVITVTGTEAINSPQRIELSISVYEPVAAAFTTGTTSGIAPLEVAFNNLSTGDYTNSLWDFGDGETSPINSPSHTFELPGTYTVTLTVNGGGGTRSLVAPALVTVYAPVAPDFSAEPVSGAVPLTVSFTNQSKGDFDTCSWTFGDGGTSTECGPVDHIYRKPGTYSVTLSLSGKGGTDNITKEGLIVVDNFSIYLPTQFK